MRSVYVSALLLMVSTTAPLFAAEGEDPIDLNVRFKDGVVSIPSGSAAKVDAASLKILKAALRSVKTKVEFSREDWVTTFPRPGNSTDIYFRMPNPDSMFVMGELAKILYDRILRAPVTFASADPDLNEVAVRDHFAVMQQKTSPWMSCRKAIIEYDRGGVTDVVRDASGNAAYDYDCMIPLKRQDNHDKH
jgi:hypothetical protein